MTDNDVIKGLACCIGTTCEGCPFKERFGKDAPCANLEKYALDLINRQKAEISELQRKNSELEIELKAMRGAANSYKSEVERLKRIIRVRSGVNLLAEMESERE